MMTDRPKLRLVEARAYEQPLRLRLPFRFGAATLDEARQLFVRVRIEDAAGRSATGMAAELMVPKWFDKSPDLSNADNEGQLRRSLLLAIDALRQAGAETAFGLHAAVETAHHERSGKEGLNGLVASFGLALADRAILDALCRLEGLPVAVAIRSNRPGIDHATTPDLAGFDLNGFLARLEPRQTIAARHTVGLADAILASDVPAADRLDDGLPESLEEAIAVYGLRHFKVKVSGSSVPDIARLRRIAGLLDSCLGTYAVTLDGNEQFASADAAAEFFGQVETDPVLERFVAAILFVEQPIARARALEKPVVGVAAFKPVEIDESDDAMDAFVAARRLGYTGISSKSCKGFYRAVLNRARVAQWNAEGEAPYFMSAEDLTTQAGLAVQQDLALAALIGLGHIERNGHHYVGGMTDGGAGAFLAAHPDVYTMRDGQLRLRIVDGRIAIGSVISANGLGSGAAPAWEALGEAKDI